MEKKHNVCVQVVHKEVSENDFANWAACSIQGWRDAQEDAHIASGNIDEEKTCNLFAVFDGHGGDCVSRFCKKYFQKDLVESENFKKKDYKEALKDACLSMDARLWTKEGLQEIYDTHWEKQEKKDERAKEEEDGKFEETPDWEMLLLETNKAKMIKKRPDAGCTANICLFVGNLLYVANVGDSRTNVLEDNCATPLSEDHKPSLDREKKRVEDAGGMIWDGRVNMKLSLTRAIGDLNFKQQFDKKPEEQILIAVPDIKEYEIKKANNKFVIMGCDGIWENEDANDKNVNQVKWNLDKMKLEDIIEEKIFPKWMAKNHNAREGTDNMTCIVIRFK